MTDARGSERAAVHWLTAQSVVFGVMAALLGIVANAMFLDAFGSAWLPATYIAIGAAGIVVSGAIARAARTADLVRIALVVLGGAALGIGAAWIVTVGGDGAWVSVPLLVLFPILIQLGFVFIGGQGGRLLDIAGIKASFPRIMAGFPVGAVLGGLAGGWLVSLLGRTEDLLLATAIAQAAFTALVWATGRRYATRLRPSPGEHEPATTSAREDDHDARPSMRDLFARPFVALILGYQVLSAVASQLADYLVFDRANAMYPDPADLAGFLAVYTAVMNIVSIGFLFLVAGPLLRRFGLRFGIAANPLVLGIFTAGMVAAFTATGGVSMALLVVVSAARIADIALTDGTTRTSINATYQVLPERERLSIQAAVEGIGVPVAIGISGVLIIVLNAVPFALAATIAVTAISCVIWSWSAVRLYRAYGPALVDALRRRRLLDPTADLDATAEDEAIAWQLLRSADPRSARLGVELLGSMTTPSRAADLAILADDPRPEVRMSALAASASGGDRAARARLAGEVAGSVGSDDPAVRVAAIDAVQPEHAFAVEAVIAALADARTIEAAAGAVARLGDAILPSLAERLDTIGRPAPPLVLRLVRAAATASPARDAVLVGHVAHPDRELGLVILERLVNEGPAPAATGQILDRVLDDDVRHAARILAAKDALTGGGGEGPIAPDPLSRALDDELELVRERVIAGRLARYGSDRLRPAMTGLAAGGPRAALAVEALEVGLGADAKLAMPVLQPHLDTRARRDRLPPVEVNGRTDRVGLLRDLIEDPDDVWRSTWLRACALDAARRLGLFDRIDLAMLRELRDPLVDEILDASQAGNGVP